MGAAKAMAAMSREACAFALGALLADWWGMPVVWFALGVAVAAILAETTFHMATKQERRAGGDG